MNFLSKKQDWFEVREDETPEQCIERMREMGYMPIARKEEPMFHYVNGEVTYFRQKIMFKGTLQKEENN